MNAISITPSSLSGSSEILVFGKLACRSEAQFYKGDQIPPMVQPLDGLCAMIVGFVRAFVEDDACCIGRLILHPDCQNRGLSTCLMTEIEALYCGKRIGASELFTESRSLRNPHLYKKLGYEPWKIQTSNSGMEPAVLRKHMPNG